MATTEDRTSPPDGSTPTPVTAGPPPLFTRGPSPSATAGTLRRAEPWTTETPSGPSDSESDYDEDELEPGWPETETASSRTSTRARLLDPAAIRQFEDVLAEGIGQVAELGNERFTPGTDLVFTTTDEEHGVAGPLARILARHAPITGEVGNPDVADVIAALLTIGRYLMRQAGLMRSLRAARAGREVDGEQSPAA